MICHKEPCRWAEALTYRVDEGSPVDLTTPGDADSCDDCDAWRLWFDIGIVAAKRTITDFSAQNSRWHRNLAQDCGERAPVAFVRTPFRRLGQKGIGLATWASGRVSGAQPSPACRIGQRGESLARWFRH